jgi:hypothetical protein
MMKLVRWRVFDRAPPRRSIVSCSVSAAMLADLCWPMGAKNLNARRATGLSGAGLPGPFPNLDAKSTGR